MPLPKHNLSVEQMEELLLSAELKGRRFIQSRIPSKEIKYLDISIEFDDSDELKLDCTIELEVVKQSKLDPGKISDEAAKKIIEFIENELKLESL